MVLGSVSFVSPGLVQTRRAVFGEVQQETQPTGDYDHEDEIAVYVGGWHWEAEAAEPQVDWGEAPPNQVGVRMGMG